MTRNRLEAFSDGVIAIIITIMVLELRPPAEPTLAALRTVAPSFATYALSFIFVAVYWNNHHHLFHAAHHINGSVLWPNMGLLFCLSLVPFGTAWMDESLFAPLPVALYGVILALCALAYIVLARALVRANDDDAGLVKAARPGVIEYISVASYLAAIALAFVNPWVSCGLYIFVALLWLIPNPRIESRIRETQE